MSVKGVYPFKLFCSDQNSTQAIVYNSLGKLGDYQYGRYYRLVDSWILMGLSIEDMDVIILSRDPVLACKKELSASL